MRVASTIVCGIVLAYVVVGAIAPNPAIGHLSTPGRGGEKDDTKPQHQLRKLLERYTLRAPMERSDHSSGIGFRSSYAEKMRRRLVQFTNESPKSAPPSQAPQTGPAPAPGPQAEMTPPPPPINPFVPPENDTLTCCCRSGNTYYEQPYQEPTPPYCCCGTRNSCCPQGSLISVICGGGQVCGILMLLSALIAVLVLSVCMTGTFYARRRRQQLLAMHATGGGAPTGAVAGGNTYRPGDFISIPEADIPGLRVKYGSGSSTTNLEGGSGEEAASGTDDHLENSTPTTTLDDGTTAADGTGTKECPICLDTVAVHSDTWAVFPCTHGCCRPCFTDLLRHSSRRVNNTMGWAVHCPLCRKVAVAPEGEIPSPAAVVAATPIAEVPITIDPPVEDTSVTPTDVASNSTMSTRASAPP